MSAHFSPASLAAVLVDVLAGAWISGRELVAHLTTTPRSKP